jgi:hypothetical protein
MTDEEINKAIAQACGWRVLEKQDEEMGYSLIVWASPFGQEEIDAPDYCGDLNEMHEAELYLTSLEQCRNYMDILDDGNGGHFATARRRAEAFLRTMGKWE